MLNSVVKYLKITFDIQNLPGLLRFEKILEAVQNLLLGIRDMREIAFKLTHVYPAMFCHKEG